MGLTTSEITTYPINNVLVRILLELVALRVILLGALLGYPEKHVWDSQPIRP